MKVIYKYPIDLAGEAFVAVELPLQSRVVHVAEQHENLCVWVELEQGQPADRRITFVAWATGSQIEPGGSHVGSAVMQGGALVLHVYEYGR